MEHPSERGRPQILAAWTVSRADSEQSGDYTLAHAIEVAGHFYLALEKAESLRLGGRINRGHLHQRLACLDSHKRLTACGAIRQTAFSLHEC